MADPRIKEMCEKFSNLSEEDFGYAVADFDDLDADKSGAVSFDEVKAYLATDGGISEHECEEYMKQYDLDGEGCIDRYLQRPPLPCFMSMPITDMCLPRLCPSGDGVITLTEYLKCMGYKPK